LDGRDLSGQYLMVDAFNTPMLGPRLKFAPEADSRDGLLDVILIQEEARSTWVSFLSSLLREEVADHPAVERQVGKSLQIAWDGFVFHLDGVVLPNGTNPPAIIADGRPGIIEIDVLPQAINLLLPRSNDEEQPANAEYGKQSQRDIPLNDSLGG
jgi:diacylglycerol kinase family enzyme